MNFIERAIEAVSPRWAAKREHERAKLSLIRAITNSGYSHHGASKTKTSTVSWNSSSKFPNEDITENLETLRERFRDLYVGGAPMGRGAIERVVLNSIGPGLMLNCRIDSEALGMSEEAAAEWERNVEREFGLWAKSLSPGRPNQAFDAFVMSLVRQIGAALGVPAELLFLHFTASYSASRGALLEAWKLFSYWRRWWAANFCQPIYFEWLCEAILKGRVSAPGFFDDPIKAYAYSWAEWNGPTQGQLDPLKEVKAAESRVQNGFSTRQRETMELTGGDWEMNHRQRIKEERMRREAGLNEPAKQADGGGMNTDGVDDQRED